MQKFCVITNNPGIDGFGGVLVKLIAMLRIINKLGIKCDLYFPVPLNYKNEYIAIDILKKYVDMIYPVKILDKVPDFLKNSFFSYRCTIKNKYDGYILVCSSLSQGLPLAKTNQPFLAWVATTYHNERVSLPRSKWWHYIFFNPITDFLTRRQEILIGKKASLIMPVSRYSARNLHRELEIPYEKIHVLPVPVDSTSHQKLNSTKESSRYLLSVSRLDRRKDFPTLLKAYKQVSEKFPDVSIRIVGSGKELEYLKKFTEDLGLSHRVSFLGLLSRSELNNQYRNAYLFTLASRQEGFGIVFVEAMTYGLPIVATNSGGSADPIQHGETGFLASVGDWHTLANYLVKLLDDKELAQRMGESGKKRAAEHFNFTVISRQLQQYFQQFFP